MAERVFFLFAAGSMLPAVKALVLAALASSTGWALAQHQQGVIPASIPPLAANRADAPKVARTEARPYWGELNAAQQQALRPLMSAWSTISDAQKRKWLALSQNFASLPAAEQARLRGRMVEWVGLSPQQRSQARLNFAETQTLTPTQKQEKWQAYQALSADEKKKLAAGVSTGPAGAAIAVKPVPQQKLASVPTAPKSNRPAPRIAIAPLPVTPDAFAPLEDAPASSSPNN